ncbi:phosphotransferase [Nocardia vinacea]|uniref:phosphotransferase family protein n=1 Tax=Nocardia vinacea TaxID=96468 RepID=UPI0034015459
MFSAAVDLAPCSTDMRHECSLALPQVSMDKCEREKSYAEERACGRDQRKTILIDWELALYGDPLYDVAVHLHKMGYQPDEEAKFLAAWANSEPEAAVGHWYRDLQTYRNHERIKSLVVEPVRYAKQFASGNLTPAQEQELIKKTVEKLQDVRKFVLRRDEKVDPGMVEDALRSLGR